LPIEVNIQTSDKNFDKEIKRKQQDEYRKFLDLQLKEQNLGKENQKLEKRGLELKTVNQNNYYDANYHEKSSTFQ
jgi:hypothetical protein